MQRTPHSKDWSSRPSDGKLAINTGSSARGLPFGALELTHEREEPMTRNNWIAMAVLTSVAAFGACSPKGGQAGQPDRSVDQQNQASDQSNNYNNDRGTTANRDKSARNPADLPVSLPVPAGTRLDLTINQELSSRKNKPGDTFTAKVATEVRDASGTRSEEHTSELQSRGLI